ncbi:serine hydrolase [Gordonia sp. PKS22-38]|uniref:Serine hydrolase n=1 Tax=Gordonia prachuapensis TaxID=3115651 RepID=A0ABU7MTR8_9ACTN|nr:serine hydrolase [Gordonia sp. PKS22-38]
MAQQSARRITRLRLLYTLGTTMTVSLVAAVLVALPTTDPESTATRSFPEAPPATLAQSALTAAESAAAAGDVDARIAILDRRHDHLATTDSATTPTLAASLVKLIVVVDILDRRREEGLAIGARDIQLINRALSVSDDQAMNELWTRFDGMGAIGRVAGRLGLEGTAPPPDVNYWGQATITASATATLLDHVLEMPPPDRDLVIAALASAPPVAADGFAQDFGLLAPGLTDAVAAKQGWMCCVDDSAQLHSAGVIGPHGRFVVVVLGRLEPTADWEPARHQVSHIASAAAQVLLADDSARLDWLPAVHLAAAA